jgi:hypothetical protein
MLSTVDLDNQPVLPANEIDDEGPDRLLPDKLAPVDGARAKPIP